MTTLALRSPKHRPLECVRCAHAQAPGARLLVSYFYLARDLVLPMRSKPQVAY